MKKIIGIIQDDTYSDAEIKQLESGLRDIYRLNYSEKEKPVVLWMIMPKGFAYAERKLSHATILLIEVDEETGQEKREKLMKLFSEFLLENFKISPLDSVITVANSSFVNGFFKAQNERVKPIMRPFTSLKVIGGALGNKLTKGYMTIPVRY